MENRGSGMIVAMITNLIFFVGLCALLGSCVSLF
jgi:hypothetical protein